MTLDACNGGFTCRARRHVHGCYSDDGNCDAPREHRPPCPIDLQRCTDRACDDGCGYIGGNRWPPPRLR